MGERLPCKQEVTSSNLVFSISVRGAHAKPYPYTDISADGFIKGAGRPVRAYSSAG